MRKHVNILLFIVGCQFAFGQDIHWSQYDHNPIFQNPVNVGKFEGDYRVNAIYRSQWQSVTKPYSTFLISGDAKNILKNLNVGLQLMHDVAGDGKMRTVDLMPSVSYSLQLTPDSVHILRAGFQVGMNFRSLNPNKLTFDNQWNGEYFDESLPINETFVATRKTNVNTGVGIGYEFQKGKRKRFAAGVGAFNLNQPNQGFFVTKERRDIRVNLFAQMEYGIALDWDILPSLQFNFQGKYMEFNLGTQARYILKDRLGEYRSVMAGIYWRSNDAFYLMAGVEYQQLWAGISYDINYSDLTLASRARGGWEISVRYIFNRFKPRIIIHRICPDFI